MNLTFDFTNRTVLVTGAAQGIGFELCWMFAESGARVVPVDRDAKTLKSTWGNASEFVLPVAIDITDPIGAEELVAACLDWGGLDIVINNAGITQDSRFWSMTDVEWREHHAVHRDGAINLTRSAMPSMRGQKRGRFVNITSHGRISHDKAKEPEVDDEIVLFTKSVARESAEYGVTANAVSPLADSQLTSTLPFERKSELMRSIPLGYFAEPREIFGAVAFLASDEASYITGIVIPVDGGMSLGIAENS